MMNSFVNLYERLTYLRNLEEKKEQVLASIEEQGKLTPELKAQIVAAETLVVWWTIFIVRIDQSAGPERQLQKKKVWSHWQI